MNSRLPITLLLLSFITLGLAYSIINPIHEATDEIRHFRFVRYIAENRNLPVQGQEPCRSQSHHPPLIYAISAVATAWVQNTNDVCYTPPHNPFWAYRSWDVSTDNKNQFIHQPSEAYPWWGDKLVVQISRAINVLVGAGVVWLTWLIGCAVWPTRRDLPLLSAAIVAFNPMFLYMAGAINNDIIAAFSGAAITLACVRLLNDPQGLSRRWGIRFGVLFGLALLSKFNLAPIIALIFAAITYVAWQTKNWRGWRTTSLWTVLISVLVAGWWFVRNQMLYGEPTGFITVTKLWGVRDATSSFGVAVSELPYAWTSLWGRFGFGQIPLPDYFYTATALLTLVAFLGILIHSLLTRDNNPTLTLLLANTAMFFAILFVYMLVSPAGPMGRFFFPALGAFGVLIVFGLEKWGTLFGKVKGNGLWGLLGGGTCLSLFSASLIALFSFLRPAYAAPPSFDIVPASATQLDVNFRGVGTLQAVDVRQESVKAGEPIDIDFYWEVTDQPIGDFLQFVHLFDANGVLIAQRDTHTGTGAYPTSQWQVGQRFIDTVRIFVPEVAYEGDELTLSTGLYVGGENGYRLAIDALNGDFLGDAQAVGRVSLGAKSDVISNQLDENFGDKIQLIGYDYSNRVAQDELTVELAWGDSWSNDIKVELALLNERNELVTTSVAKRFAIYTFDITNLSAGIYRPDLVVRDADGGRLNRLHESGNWIDDHLTLSPILVVE